MNFCIFRQTRLILTANIICYCLPQIICTLLRLFIKSNFASLLVQQLFLLKFIANLILYQLMCRTGRGLIYSVSFINL